MNVITLTKTRHSYAVWFSFLLLFLLQGCETNFIADYDAETDKAVTQLQRKFETFFVDLESNIGSDKADYENYTSFYKSAKVDISAIKLRAGAMAKNEITIEQVSILENNLGILEELHKDGIAIIDIVSVVRQDFNAALSYILKLELAKKHPKQEINQ